MDFKIVFIDDNLSEKEPFVQNIRKHYKDIADCSNVYKDPNEGLQYVLENLNNKMIVFIDWNFSGKKIKGIDLLKEIRKKTSLLYIVMMSANQLFPGISQEDIIEMMNEENFFYCDRSNADFEKPIRIIDKIRFQWSSKFDCVLEQWLTRHPEDNGKVAYTEASTGKEYTWNDIINELRMQTSVGISFEKNINQYYIYQLGKSKK